MSYRQWWVGLVAALALGAMAVRAWSNRIDTAQPSAPPGRITTILVAPFVIIGSASESLLGAKLAEQVCAALSTDKSVDVKRSEVQPANAQLPAARRAGAQYVLTGAVDRKRRGVEIAMRLVRAADGSTAWSGTFWKSVADFPSSAGDLAAAVSEAIRAQRDSEARRYEHPPLQDPH